MSDFIVTDATTVGGDRVDIEIRDGTVDRVVPAGEGDPGSVDADRHLDAEGRLVTPPLIEVHAHLDHLFTAGNPYWNESNTLDEAWRTWAEIRDDITEAEFKARARRGIEWFLAHGVTRIRTHVNTGYESLAGVRALVELREELSDVVDLQLVAFPVDCLFTETEGNKDLFEEALDLGADVVGGIPHKEYTDQDGARHVQYVVDTAERRDLPLDLHIDESDDPQCRFTEILASEVLKRGMGDRATASHVTALHSYPNAYADKLIGLIADSGLDVITNPMANAALQGRYDDYPRRRGYTRIDELRDAGVTVGVGQDDILDLFNNYGDGDPLKNAFVLAHYAHMNGYADVSTIWEMILEANASIYGADDYGLEPGARGSLVVHDARDAFDALRMQPPRTLVLRDGRPIARSTRSTTLIRDGEETQVDFGRFPEP